MHMTNTQICKMRKSTRLAMNTDPLQKCWLLGKVIVVDLTENVSSSFWTKLISSNLITHMSKVSLCRKNMAKNKSVSNGIMQLVRAFDWSKVSAT
jgi:hypothetical protein